MSLKLDSATYAIELYTGDTGNIELTSLPIDKNYSVYLAVRDISTNSIIVETPPISTQNASSITIPLSKMVTNQLVVPSGSVSQLYYWGIKICDSNGTEDTLFLGNTGYGDIYTLTAYPKEVEGAV